MIDAGGYYLQTLGLTLATIVVHFFSVVINSVCVLPVARKKQGVYCAQFGTAKPKYLDRTTLVEEDKPCPGDLETLKKSWSSIRMFEPKGITA